MTEADAVLVERDGPVTVVSINRPHCRNAVDGATARLGVGSRDRL
jgi:enoyl-CoA hydratase